MQLFLSYNMVFSVSASFIACIAGCRGSVVVDGSGGADGSASSGTPSSSGPNGSNGSSGSGGSPSTGDCASDADCGGKSCAPLTPGGYMVCLAPPPAATMCQPKGPAMDFCCTSADCSGGKCYNTMNLPCQSTASADYNTCVTDGCVSDAQCIAGGLPAICTPAGAFGMAERVCMLAYCHTNTDCNAKPGGSCVPIEGECCSLPDGLGCLYPGGCRRQSDCSSDSYCDIDVKQKAGVCIKGVIAYGVPEP